MLRIVYIISAYHLPEQLIRLIHRLNRESVSFLVHIDKKTDPRTYETMARGLRHVSNVQLLKRYPCYWGGFGHVQASLAGIRELVRQRLVFDYAFLLTGQDYPIKTNIQIQDFLEMNKGRSFLANFPLPCEEWENGGLERVERWYVHSPAGRFVFPRNGTSGFKRKLPKGLVPFGGSSYWCLGRDAIEYIDHFVQTHPGFVSFFKYVDVPDEIFYQTILMNSSLASTVANNDLRYIDWKDPSSGSPSVLGTDDFDKISSSPQLIARKFDVRVDAEILDRIDRQILAEAGEGAAIK